MASIGFQILSICLLLNFFEIVQQVYLIKGPKHINGSIGEDALFMWNTTDRKEILAVSWGIRKGNIPDPQFISVDGYHRRVTKNKDIGETLKRRVEFLGNLTMGRAWFVLKNLTVNDTNEYIASISDDESSDIPYCVRLNVTEKRKEKPTEGPSPTPDTTAAAPNNTRAPTNKTNTFSNITTPPEPNSSNIQRHINGYTILTDIALVLWHFSI
ncbi:uncharacterized protein LOC116292496 isoform X2 [Actinia tenebrosa]|uniref:Uncharacterized protein LOC116292496 isoform X2 n=1 Tax=Actinia tenebrosa TaxID=6105 RepID=A0A6P8HSS8_ACTTE|nr:uncharacterized protein LOC116292496 isoform X2 [Actinia tenebrosa]